MLIFGKKMLTSAKLRKPWYQKIYFLKLYMCVYLRTKFQVSSIIITSFRQGEGGWGVLPPPQNEPLKIPPKLGLKECYWGLWHCGEKGKLSNKTPYYRKIFIAFADNIGLITIRSDLMRFKHILCFSKIEGSIIT